MTRDRAAYMREYRARMTMQSGPDPQVRIRELEEEVRHLKRQLAERPAVNASSVSGFNTRPFTPVPKRR